MLHHYTFPTHPDHSPALLLGDPTFTGPPILVEAISAPVRLLVPYSMSLGTRGQVAVWTDTQTEEYFNHSDSGQRIAGCILGQKRPEGEVQTRSADCVYSFSEQDSWVKVQVDEDERRLAIADDNGKTVVYQYQ
jgi:hypothetical protein